MNYTLPWIISSILSIFILILTNYLSMTQSIAISYLHIPILFLLNVIVWIAIYSFFKTINISRKVIISVWIFFIFFGVINALIPFYIFNHFEIKSTIVLLLSSIFSPILFRIYFQSKKRI